MLPISEVPRAKMKVSGWHFLFSVTPFSVDPPTVTISMAWHGHGHGGMSMGTCKVKVPEEEEEEPMRSLSPERPFVPWDESEDPDPEEEPEEDDPRPGKSWRSSTLVGAVRAEVVRAKRTREYFILTEVRRNRMNE